MALVVKAIVYVDLITTKSVKWSQKEIFLDQRKYAVPIWIDNNIIENFEHGGSLFLNEAHLVLITALKCHSRVQFYIRSTFTILSIELTMIKQFMNNLWRESFMMMFFFSLFCSLFGTLRLRIELTAASKVEDSNGYYPSIKEVASFCGSYLLLSFLWTITSCIKTNYNCTPVPDNYFSDRR